MEAGIQHAGQDMVRAIDAGKSERVSSLDGLRFVAAFSVLLYHYVSSYLPRIVAAPSNWMLLSMQVTRYGYLGVNLFFMISGFVILWSSAKRTPTAFAISRFSRLYPTFWACLGLTSLAILAFGSPEQTRVITARAVAANATMLPTVFRVPRIDDVYWTLEVELYFYVLVFVLLIFGQMRQIQKWLLAWVVMIAVQERFAESSILNHLTLAPYGPYFAAGCMYFIIYRDGQRWWKTTALAATAGMALFQAGRDRGGFIDPDGVSAVVVPLLVLVSFVVMWEIAVGRRWSAAAHRIAPLGTLTYPLYLTHAGIGILLLQSLPDVLPVSLRLLVVSTAALTLAAIIAVVIDQPARKLLSVWLTSLARRARFRL